MKTTKVRRLLAGTAATVVLAAAGVGTAIALDSDESQPEPQPPIVQEAPVTDAGPNPWAVDCAMLLDVLGEEAHAYGC